MKDSPQHYRTPHGVVHVSSAAIEAQWVHHFALDNGLQVLLWPDSQAPVVAYQTWFKVGSADEQPGRTGMAHLFEHLMFKETKNREAGVFDRLLESNGIETNAATWLDWTYYKESLPSQHLELVMELEADRMENMLLSQAQLDTERDVVINERLLRVDNDPEGLASERLFHLHFGRHPYGHPTIGWMDDIKAITIEDCFAFHKRYYGPENAILVLCGDLDVGNVLELLYKYYGAIPRGAGGRVASRSRVALAGGWEVLHLPVNMSKVMLLYPAPKANEGQAMVMRVAGELLWGAESSLLRESLIHRRQLLYDMGAYHVALRLAGALELQLNLAPEVEPDEALETMHRTLKRFLKAGIGEEELQGAKNRVEMAYLRSLLHTGSRARGLGHTVTTIGDWRRLSKMRQLLAAVTAPQCLEIVKTTLVESRPTRVDVTPQAEGGAL